MKANYRVNAIDKETSPRVHRISAWTVEVKEGTYQFKNGAYEDAHAIFPIRSYYVVKES